MIDHDSRNKLQV